LGEKRYSFFDASYEKGSSPLQTLFSVVTLDGLGDDGAGGVAALVVLTLGGDGTSHIAGRESQCDRCTRHDGRRESDDDFVDTLFGHNGRGYGLGV